jgi:hypothetical protein
VCWGPGGLLAGPAVHLLLCTCCGSCLQRMYACCGSTHNAGRSSGNRRCLGAGRCKHINVTHNLVRRVCEAPVSAPTACLGMAWVHDPDPSCVCRLATHCFRDLSASTALALRGGSACSLNLSCCMSADRLCPRVVGCILGSLQAPISHSQCCIDAWTWIVAQTVPDLRLLCFHGRTVVVRTCGASLTVHC